MSIRHTKYHKPPVFKGEIFVEKEPPEGYIGKHAYWGDHDRIGQNGVVWLGCRMCVEDLGLSYPLGSVREQQRDRYWNQPQV